MLVEKKILDNYKKEFIKKFSKLCKNIPIKISFYVDSSSDKMGVVVEHIKSKRQYYFPWDLKISVKDFIHNIEKTLEENHYPYLKEIIKEEKTLSSDELAQLLLEGVPSDELPNTKIESYEILWRFKRIMLNRGRVLLKNTENNYIGYYKIPKEILKDIIDNYSNRTLDESSEMFFKNSVKINK